MDMEVHTEYDNLDAAQDAEEVDNQGEVENSAAEPSGGGSSVADDWTTEFS